MKYVIYAANQFLLCKDAIVLFIGSRQECIEMYERNFERPYTILSFVSDTYGKTLEDCKVRFNEGFSSM